MRNLSRIFTFHASSEQKFWAWKSITQKRKKESPPDPALSKIMM
jgi:hypothetical protein